MIGQKRAAAQQTKAGGHCERAFPQAGHGSILCLLANATDRRLERQIGVSPKANRGPFVEAPAWVFGIARILRYKREMGKRRRANKKAHGSRPVGFAEALAFVSGKTRVAL
jgi:hypothetical protein